MGDQAVWARGTRLRFMRLSFVRKVDERRSGKAKTAQSKRLQRADFFRKRPTGGASRLNFKLIHAMTLLPGDADREK